MQILFSRPKVRVACNHSNFFNAMNVTASASPMYFRPVLNIFPPKVKFHVYPTSASLMQDRRPSVKAYIRPKLELILSDPF